MHRAVLILLVGLMLSLNGGASALTFKSDGSVVQSDGTVVSGDLNDQKSMPDWKTVKKGIWCIESKNAGWSGPTLYWLKGGFFRSCGKKTAKKISVDEIKRLVSNGRIAPEYICNRSNQFYFFKFLEHQLELDCVSKIEPTIGSQSVARAVIDPTNIRALARLPNQEVCRLATKNGLWKTGYRHKEIIDEASSRGLTCGVVGKPEKSKDTGINLASAPDDVPKFDVAKKVSNENRPANRSSSDAWDLFAGIRDINQAISEKMPSIVSRSSLTEKEICKFATIGDAWSTNQSNGGAVNIYYLNRFKHLSDFEICKNAVRQIGLQKCVTCVGNADSRMKTWKYVGDSGFEYSAEAIRRDLSCGLTNSNKHPFFLAARVNNQMAPTAKKATEEKFKEIEITEALTDAEKRAAKAQKEADELRARLATLEASQNRKRQAISSDTEAPIIVVDLVSSSGPKGTIFGKVMDNTGVAEVRVDGRLVEIDRNGSFATKTYVPEDGISVIIEAFDLAGLSTSTSVRLSREKLTSTNELDFERLNPISREAVTNSDALALIIGLEQYEKTDAKAAYADVDAKVFADYASLKLGIPQNRIKTLVNDNAEITDVLLSVKNWLSRAVKQEQSDVYIFFAGHGLASDDGEKMYLLPYDGAPELLDKTSILRDELFTDIAAANPRSVTVFLDTCYSGTTRGPDMLIASRPIAIRAKEQAVPDGFTVMTAAAGDQTAKPLEEAKHGMFSYFLMKGMEGDADTNRDNQITAGELHAYVQQNVIQQSSGSQTPELQGDADRVLVRFQ